MIELVDLKFSYTGAATALEGVSLTIRGGDAVALIGANGSGKSTLLKVIAGLVVPDAGTYEFQGRRVDAAALADPAVSKDLHRRVGFLFQNSEAQLFCPTVEEELAFGPLQLGLDPGEVETRVADCAGLLDIRHLLPKASYQLSDGEKRRVALAAVLSLNPEVLVLDEPLNALDPRTKRFLVDLLGELNAAGKTIVAATHDFAPLEGVLRTAVILSQDHRVVRVGDYAEIVADRETLTAHNII